jgi:4-aminobutyrate--pyruvate transaminase
MLNSLQSRDLASCLHPVTNLVDRGKDGPLVIARGEGVRIYDDSGKEYIDAGAGLWCVSLGYSEKRLIRAAAEQMERLPYGHFFRNTSHEPGAALAEKLLRMLPVKMSKVFFGTSGSEAIESAVKMVWYYNNALGRPQKKKIISRMKAFHGASLAGGSLTGLPKTYIDFDLPLQGFRHTDCPHFYAYGKPGETEEDFATRMAENLDSLIQREGPNTVAAFIAEPVQGTGGVIVPPRTYFEKIQSVLQKHDVLFIVDEVMCGFGRTGNLFGTQTYDLKPDMVVMSKALSGAYMPISAVALVESIYQTFIRQSEKIGNFAHGYTYSAHPVCAAVALEALRIYEGDDIVGRVNSVMPRFWAHLRRFADHELVGEVRGVGLLAAVALVKDKATKRPFSPADGIGARLVKQCIEHGLMIRSIEDAVAFSPPLVISEQEIDELFARFEKALEDVRVSLPVKG